MSNGAFYENSQLKVPQCVIPANYVRRMKENTVYVAQVTASIGSSSFARFPRGVNSRALDYMLFENEGKSEIRLFKITKGKLSISQKSNEIRPVSNLGNGPEGDGSGNATGFNAAEKDSLWQEFKTLVSQIKDRTFTPVMYCRRGEGQSAGAPVEFSLIPLTHYADCSEVAYQSPSALLEDFYARKNLYTRIRQRSADLRHIVQTILERDIHKYDLQCRQIKDTEKRDKYKVYGELLNAYGYSVPAGAKSCVLDNYYTGQKITVPLDPTLTPQQNAQKYFDRYARMKRTHEALTRLTAEVSAEIDHLRSIQNALAFSTTDGDLSQIRREMEESGFLRRKYTGRKDARADGRKGRARPPQSRPLHYVSSDGYDIYVGKNNTQNDEITFRMADSRDIWFHANDMPGSHVLLRTGGRSMDEIPDRVFEEAASLAAYYSSGREQGKVEIDYLERRNVKKPSGAAPGFVVYYTNYSIIAKTDISALREVQD
jgi:predicted ribosome quality control (RQC) complex YloA/Tae2 family protein